MTDEQSVSPEDKKPRDHNNEQPKLDIQHPIHFLKLPDVLKKTRLTKARLYAMTRKGRFPKQVKLGARAVAWVESEIHGWMIKRMNERF